MGFKLLSCGLMAAPTQRWISMMSALPSSRTILSLWSSNLGPSFTSGFTLITLVPNSLRNKIKLVCQI